MSEDWKKDLNGLGGKVNNMAIEMGSVKTKVERNEEDIQRLLKSVAKQPLWIVGTVAVPSLMLLYQLIVK